MLNLKIKTPLMHSLTLSLLAYSTNALPAPPNVSGASPDDAKWSKEAILALVGVMVAVLLFAVGLASKALRAWFIDTFSRTSIRLLSDAYSQTSKLTLSVCTRQRASHHSQNDDSSTRLLRQRAQEWVEFNEWRAYVERRGNS